MSPSEQAAGVWALQWFLCLVSNAADFLALGIRASWVVRPLPGSDHGQQKLSLALATLPTTIHPDTVSLPDLCACPAEPASGAFALSLSWNSPVPICAPGCLWLLRS